MYGAPAGVIVGCDYSGIVDLVGSAVSRFKVSSKKKEEKKKNK